MKINWQKSVLFFYTALTACLLGVCLYFAYKYKFNTITYFALIITQLWLWLIGFRDLQIKKIELFLTAPVLLSILPLAFLYPITSPEFEIIGIRITPFECGAGIVFGFLITDILTHFGNWIMKFPQSGQGLLSIWIALPLMIISIFVPALPLWVSLLSIVIFWFLLAFLSQKNKTVQIQLEKLCTNPLLAYTLLLGLMLIFGYIVVFQPQLISEPLEKSQSIIFLLCFSYLLNEVCLPIFSKNQKEEEETLSVLGGGDAYLNACIGSLWGATSINTFLILAVFLAFIFIGICKLFKINQLSSSELNLNNTSFNEIAFAPFIVFSVQLVTILALSRSFG